MGGVADLAGAVAVVTGGASGIGRATAVALAREGADIALGDLNQGRLAEARAEIEALGRRCLAARVDVTSDTDMASFATNVHNYFGRVDIAMLNAGVSVLGPPDLVSLDDWRWQMEVNFFGVVRGVQSFVPAMRARGSGHVVIVASIAGRYAYSYDAGPYVTSKFAAYGLAENLALYCKPQGVEVTVVCPGLVSTNLGENARFSGFDPSTGWSHFPSWMVRAITPDEVGEQIVAAIRDKRFLVYTHPEDEALIIERSRDVDAAIAAQIEKLPDPTPRG